MAGMSVGVRARGLRRSNWSSVNSQARLELQLARSGSLAAIRCCVWLPGERSCGENAETRNADILKS